MGGRGTMYLRRRRASSHENDEMRKHTNYEDNWIIDSGCLNHMIDDQKKFLQDLNNIEKNSTIEDGGTNYTYLVKC